MLRGVADIFILLFIYRSEGTPLGDRPRSGMQYGYLAHFIPSQWGKNSEMPYHWPKGEVPYFFDTSSYDEMLMDKVRMAMASLERDSCIRFKEQKTKPAANGSSWLHFTNQKKQRHCFHSPSYRANGEIAVILGYDCLKQWEITHAVMHGIGFRDEVTHPQRDLYVKILWRNIQPANRILFRIQSVERPSGLMEYDPKSIMHFHDHAYSVNGQATISALLPGLKITPSDHLSHLDKMKLGIMFGHECNRRKVSEVLDTCQGLFSDTKKNDSLSFTTLQQSTIAATTQLAEEPDEEYNDGKENSNSDKQDVTNPNLGDGNDDQWESMTDNPKKDDTNVDDGGKIGKGNDNENTNKNVVVIVGHGKNAYEADGTDNQCKNLADCPFNDKEQSDNEKEKTSRYVDDKQIQTGKEISEKQLDSVEKNNDNGNSNEDIIDVRDDEFDTNNEGNDNNDFAEQVYAINGDSENENNMEEPAGDGQFENSDEKVRGNVINDDKIGNVLIVGKGRQNFVKDSTDVERR